VTYQQVLVKNKRYDICRIPLLLQKRLDKNPTQEGLAKRSGVSLGSLKRFESSGHISLESLLKLALVLELFG
jgi:transcriptional regulator with XRE-family HTH domain